MMDLTHERQILEFLSDKNLIVVSNRGPVEFYKENGEMKMKRGAGGLVSTLLPLMEALNGVWIASAMTPGDVEMANQFPERRVPIPEDDPRFCVPFVVVHHQPYEDYYSVISNPLLWFVQHYMYNSPYTPDIDDDIHDAWTKGYVYMNKQFAEKAIVEAKRKDKEPIIMLQDYHLYLCPTFIRQELPDTFLTQFIHIPWPQAEYFKILPKYMRESIIEGLLANNLVGFHIPRYAINFIQTCQEYADHCNYEKGVIWHNGHATHVRSYPISIDYDATKKLAQSNDVIEKEKQIKEVKDDCFLIYRTDRADLSKNIIRGFKAYDLFLKKNPEYQKKVIFLTTGKPTRTEISEYEEYHLKIKEVVDAINFKYSSDGWKPIKWIFKADYNLVLAAFKNYDCLIVNPIADGMNIVPKEASVVNENNGSLIISETAGCYDELKDHAITVNPYDIRQTAEAYKTAIEMSMEERSKHLNGLKEIVAHRTIYDWISEQFDDIKRIKDLNTKEKIELKV